MSRVAVITGASRGIGAATADSLRGGGFGWLSIIAPVLRRQKRWAAITAAGEAMAIQADVPAPDDVTGWWANRSSVRRLRLGVGSCDIRI